MFQSVLRRCETVFKVQCSRDLLRVAVADEIEEVSAEQGRDYGIWMSSIKCAKSSMGIRET